MTEVTGPARVLLVEDEPNARQRCAEIIENHEKLHLSAQCHCMADALDLLKTRRAAFDFLLTDLELGDGNGADLIRVWRDGGGQNAMVITVFGDVDSVMRAVEAGADGYLLKSGSDQEMIAAIDTVLEGGAPISAAVAGHLLKKLRRSSEEAQSSEPEEALTPRELEVLTDLAHGQSYKEVARTRGISPHTVAGHVKVIYRKLSVNSRGEAVFRAVQEGLINLSRDT